MSFLSLSDGVPASSLGSRLLYTRSLLAMLSFPGSGGEWQVQEWAEGEDELQPCNLALSQPPGALPWERFQGWAKTGRFHPLVETLAAAAPGRRCDLGHLVSLQPRASPGEGLN